MGLPTRKVSAGRGQHVLALIIATAITCGALINAGTGTARFVIGALGGLIFFVISTSGRNLALVMTVVWLTMLGFTRRLLIPFVGWSPQDPLLLVGLALALMLWMSARRAAPRARDAMTQLVVLLMIWSVAQVLNPAHTVLAGAYGAMFLVGPLLWFFVGRTLDENQFELFAKTLIVMMVPVALHGLYQTSGRFFPFELTWIGVSGFGSSIFINGFNIRPFSTLVSPQEYGNFLALVLTILWTRILLIDGKRLPRLGLFALGTIALFLQGSRSIFAYFCLMLVVTSVMHFRSVLPRLAIYAMIVGGVVYLTVGTPPERPVDASPAAGILQHQLSGLMDPSNSTAPLHYQLVLDAVSTAIDNPFGLGAAASTRAFLKLGVDNPQRSPENDVAAILKALGIAGGLSYLAFIIVTFVTATRMYLRNPHWRNLASIGVCIAMLGHWWTGSLYAVSSFFWLTLGTLAAMWAKERSVENDWSESELLEPELAPVPAVG